MGTELAKAYVQIIPSADGISGALSNVLGGEAESAGKESGEKASSSFGSAFANGLKTAGVVIGAVTTAAAAFTGALIKGTGDVATYGDNIDKMSQKMGLSAEAYQEWDAIMQHSGTSIDSLQSGMKTLANAVESGNEAFKRLGITQDMIAGMDNEQLFSATIAALQNVDNETERTYLAGQLLGRGATELGALLNTSAEDTEAMRQRVHELGGVMSDEAVKSAAAYQDSLQDMQTAFSGLSRGMLSEFLPSITSVMEGLADIFSGDTETGLARISVGIEGFVDTLEYILPQVIEVGSEIVLSLSQAITDNLPWLIGAAADAVLTIGAGLIEQLPSIVSAGLEVILSLANGIAESLPDLIPTIIDVVIQIVDTLTAPDTLGNLIDASIAIITALADGLVDSLPQLMEKAPEIISNLIQALINNAPKLVQSAAQIITELADGLIDNLPMLIEQAPVLIADLVQAIVDNAPALLKAALEIIVKLAEGILENLPQILDAAAEIVFTLIEGIAELLGELVMMGKDLVDSVADGFDQKVEDARQWGKDLIKNFIDGITQKWNDLKKSVSNIAQTVKDYIGFSEPAKGPLSNFHTFAPDMMDLFTQGIRDSEGELQRQIAATTSVVENGLATSITAPSISMADVMAGTVNGIQTAMAGTGGGTYTFNLVLPDGAVLARYTLNSLIDVARANGTPILNPM